MSHFCHLVVFVDLCTELFQSFRFHLDTTCNNHNEIWLHELRLSSIGEFRQEVTHWGDFSIHQIYLTLTCLAIVLIIEPRMMSLF